jgi:tRNA U34 5-methylaminomethyl-2-thiouridine-forming methyltransferase MnmC
MSFDPGNLEIVTVASGARSLRLCNSYETFHPVVGPEVEPRVLHVEQQKILERSALTEPFVIWDVGLGAAANSIAAIGALKEAPARIELHSFDLSLAPLLFAIHHAESLPYVLPYKELLGELCTKNRVSIRDRFEWFLHIGDFRETMVHAPAPSSVFYDPYSPSTNVDMWTLSHFKKMRMCLPDHTPCLLTNYTRSSITRVTLLLAGFYVGVGVGVAKKEETTIFSNSLSLLERPLDKNWLEKRLSISHSAAPLVDTYRIAPLSEQEFAAVASLPQFQ